jgi:glucose/arabinose dehydrogenase
MTHLRLIVALVAALALASCGGDDERDAPPRAETQATSEEPPARGTESGGRELARAQGRPEVRTWVADLDVPWELVFMPDGRALVTLRGGEVRVISRAAELEPEPAAQIEVSSLAEDGLLGMALDPSFERNGLVYIYRTVESGNEVARYRFARDRLRDERVLVSGIAAAAIHDGGRMRFGPGGRLYFSTGDAGERELAQDPGSLNGKILRLSRSQYRGSGGRPEVFTLGHRNPQGFDWQPGTDLMVGNEHGESANDEVNVLRRGGNYGWPEIEGGEEREGLISPAAYYERTLAPSGSTFVKLPGSAWTGDYLIAGLAGEQIRRVGFDGDRVTRNEPLFEGEYGRIRAVVEGPDGALYALTNNTDGRGSPQEGDDRILRIVPPAD